MKSLFVALAAAALVAVPTSGALAKGSKTVNVTLDSFCDSFTITTTGSVSSIADDESCTTWYGVGLQGKLKSVGKSTSFGMITPGQPATSYYVTFSYPYVTGGTFNMYITNDGLNGDGFLALTDTYTVAGTPSQGQRGTKSASTLAHH